MSSLIITGGSIPGPPSKKRGKPNQDYYGFSEISDDSVIIVAADGAGSLELSDIGSQLAVETVIETIISDNTLSLEDAVETAREKLLNHPDKKQLGCTLVAALIDKEEYHISITGDAFAVAQTIDNDYILYQNTKFGEYANITKLLTSSTTDTQVYHGSTENIEGIAVSSDGLEHFTIDNQTLEPTAGFWRTVFSRAKNNDLDVISLFEYMNSLEKIDDDTTMVVAVKE